jgi:hypothetical protein
MTLLFSPYFWLALAGVFALGWTSGCTHEHKEVTRLEASIEADRQVRLAAATAEAEARAAVVVAQEAEQARIKGERDAAFADLAARNKERDTLLARSRVDRDLVARLRDTISTANASAPKGAAGEPSKDPASPAGDTSGSALAGWFDKVAKLYNECRDEVIGWNAYWDKEAAIP